MGTKPLVEFNAIVKMNTREIFYHSHGESSWSVVCEMVVKTLDRNVFAIERVPFVRIDSEPLDRVEEPNT